MSKVDKDSQATEQCKVLLAVVDIIFCWATHFEKQEKEAITQKENAFKDWKAMHENESNETKTSKAACQDYQEKNQHVKAMDSLVHQTLQFIANEVDDYLIKPMEI